MFPSAPPMNNNNNSNNCEEKERMTVPSSSSPSFSPSRVPALSSVTLALDQPDSFRSAESFGSAIAIAVDGLNSHDLSIPLIAGDDDALSPEEEMKRALVVSRSETYSSDRAPLPPDCHFVYNKIGQIQGKSYERVRVFSNNNKEEEHATEEDMDKSWVKRTGGGITSARSSRSTAWKWFQRMRPVRESVMEARRGGSGSGSGREHVGSEDESGGSWRKKLRRTKSKKAWENRIVSIDKDRSLLVVYYQGAERRKKGSRGGSMAAGSGGGDSVLTVRRGRPSHIIDLSARIWTLGEIYMRPKQSQGLVLHYDSGDDNSDVGGIDGGGGDGETKQQTSSSGVSLRPVHQLKIFKNKREHSKLGFVHLADAEFVREVALELLEQHDTTTKKSKSRKSRSTLNLDAILQ